jgi:1-acyl-sn-glycerol-3-phosphate acyltransferase
VRGIRSVIFILLGVVYTLIYTLPVTLGSLVHRPFGFICARQWCWWVIQTARVVCGIRYRIVGSENIPPPGVSTVVMARHESAWETIMLPILLGPQTWIVKRELLWLPLIGQCIWALRAVAIDRRAGKAARDQVVEQGRERLALGLHLIVFPEGTRVGPRENKRYGLSGFMLAEASGAAILPIAHNAGDCWPRYAFVKREGEITLSIGPRIQPMGQGAQTLAHVTERWIATEQARIREGSAVEVPSDAVQA